MLCHSSQNRRYEGYTLFSRKSWKIKTQGLEVCKIDTFTVFHSLTPDQFYDKLTLWS